MSNKNDKHFFFIIIISDLCHASINAEATYYREYKYWYRVQ